jgi:hypothetical protein
MEGENAGVYRIWIKAELVQGVGQLKASDLE